MAARARGFSLVELLVVVAIISLLFSLVLPALHQARQAALRAGCMGNLRAISGGLYAYIVDNNGQFPRSQIPTTAGSLTGNHWYSNLTPWMDLSRQENPNIFRYGEDNHLPDPGSDWKPGRAAAYNAVWQKLMCPAQRGPVYAIRQGIRSTYGYVTEFRDAGFEDNGMGVYFVWRYSSGHVRTRLLEEISRPSITAAVMDSGHHYVHPRWYGVAEGRGMMDIMFPDRHDGYATLFVDGHARLLAVEEVANPQSIIWRAW